MSTNTPDDRGIGDDTGGGDIAADAPNRRRLLWWLVPIVAVLLVGGGLTAAILAGQNGDPDDDPAIGAPSTSPSTSPSASPGASASPDPSASPSTPPVDPDFGQPVIDTVPHNGTANFGDGVTAQIVELSNITVEATGAGEVSGPAIRVVVRLSNTSAAAVSVASVSVNGFYGEARQPASPLLSAPDQIAFSGTLAAGASAEGAFVFSVPEADRANFFVTVSKDASSPLVLFTP